MQAENKTLLQTTDIAEHLKAPSKPLTDIELQQDYDYFKAQETDAFSWTYFLVRIQQINAD